MFSDTQEKKPSVNRVSLFEMPLDIEIDNQDVVKSIASGNILLSYLNPYAYKVAQHIPRYSKDLSRFDLVVCDGTGIQLAAKAVFGVTTPILTPDYSGIGRNYLQFAEGRQMTLCLVGSKQTTVQAAKARISKEYSSLAGITAFSGYDDSLTEAKKFVLASSPDMVLVGMGMGIQEAYLLELVDSGWNGIGICVGGFFDKLANPHLEYPTWSEKTRLRFLARLIKEPRRLSRRYFVDYQPFIRMYIKHVFESH